MKQKIRRKHPHRVKFLQMKKEDRMCNQSIKDLGESIDKLTRAIEKVNDCSVLKRPKWMCWRMCCCGQILASIIAAGYLGYLVYQQRRLTELLIVSGIFLCLFIYALITLIHMVKINRQSLLTTGYNEAIQEINKNAHSTETKINHTITLYQHYCQSLTKR